MTRVLSLNRPKQLNSLTLEMIRYLTPRIKVDFHTGTALAS